MLTGHLCIFEEVCTLVPPLSSGDMFPNPQWMPETAVVLPYICYIFSYTDILMKKFNLKIRYGKRSVTIK